EHHRVFPDVVMHVEHDGFPAGSQGVRIGHEYPVSDVAHFEHHVIGFPMDDPAPQKIDHRAVPPLRRNINEAVWAWQTATASASATSSGSGTTGSLSSMRTISCICFFSAPP